MRAVELAEYFPGDRVHSDFVALTGLDGALDERVRQAGGEVIKCRLDARFAVAFYRLLKKRRYDVVHSHVHYSSGFILAIARAAGVPGRVAHLHTAVVNGRKNTLRRRAQLAICRGLLQQHATDIVACGEGTMQVAWGPTVDCGSAVPCHLLRRSSRPRALGALRPDADAHRRECRIRAAAQEPGPVDRGDAPPRQACARCAAAPGGTRGGRLRAASATSGRRTPAWPTASASSARCPSRCRSWPART